MDNNKKIFFLCVKVQENDVKTPKTISKYSNIMIIWEIIVIEVERWTLPIFIWKVK